MKKTATLAVLAAAIVFTAACTRTPDAEVAADATTTTTVARPKATTTTVDKRPGSSQVYADIAAETDCASLQASFDRADATNKRPGGPAGTTWRQIGLAYMEAADDRMSKIGCYR